MKSGPSDDLHEIAPTLADLRKLSPEQKCRPLLARLAKIGKDPNALNKNNLMLPTDPYGLASGYAAVENTAVREHLLGAPWTKLINEGYLTDVTGQGFFKVTEEGREYLLSREIAAQLSSTVAKSETSETGVPRVFVSYTWEGREHQEWVAKLAERLQGEGGIAVTFDRWQLTPGYDKLLFMEKAVSDNDFVVVICTPTYAERANNRQGGVGYESMVITGELAQKIQTNKFIPVLRLGTWPLSLPTYLQSRIGVNLSGEPYNEGQYQSLLGALHGETIQVPPIGSKPNFSATPPASEENRKGLSLKPNFKHKRLPIIGGPTDDEELYELSIGIMNDGEKDATDFRLDVEIPAGFVEGGAHMTARKSDKPGVRLFQVVNTERKITHLYPGTATPPLITLECVIRGRVKREHPESLQQSITITVYSGSMVPHVTTISLGALRM